jgi:hypothetical protein
MRTPTNNRAKKPTANRAAAKKARPRKSKEQEHQQRQAAQALKSEMVECGLAYGDAGTYPVSFCIIATAEEFLQRGQRLLRSIPTDAEVCVLVNREAKAGEAVGLGPIKQHDCAIDLKTREWLYEPGTFCFATARNHAQDMANHDWVFWLDCDEVLVHSQHVGIRDLARELPKGFGGVVAGQASLSDYGEEEKNAIGNYVNIGQVRMYRKSTGARWYGRCHEQIAESITSSGYALKRTDITVVHSGYVLSKDALTRKLRRNTWLLALQFVEMGMNHPLAPSYLEMLVRDAGGLIKIGGHYAG